MFHAIVSLGDNFVSLGDNLHEMSKHISGKNKRNISNCHLLKFLPSMLSDKKADLYFYCLYMVGSDLRNSRFFFFQ